MHEVKMLYRIFLISIIAFIPATIVVGNCDNESSCNSQSSECKVTTNTTASLDLAIQIIKNVQDSKCVCPPLSHPSDCEDILRRGHNRSGVYKVLPRSRSVQNPIEVYCDMVTVGGGWTVIQRRGNFLRPVDYFYQDWQSYKKGFGDVERDFWLGNDNIYALSNQKEYSIRFDLRDVKGDQGYALYDTFWINGEEHKYMLHINGYSGNAGDSMTKIHNGMKFTTKDQKNDNEEAKKESCAEQFKGGWWYNRCHESNLNGLYLRGKHESYADGVNWRTWREYHESLEWTEMKIRRRDFRPCKDDKVSTTVSTTVPTTVETPTR